MSIMPPKDTPDKDGQPTKSLIRSAYLIDEDGVITKALGGKSE